MQTWTKLSYLLAFSLLLTGCASPQSVSDPADAPSVETSEPCESTADLGDGFETRGRAAHLASHDDEGEPIPGFRLSFVVAGEETTLCTDADGRYAVTLPADGSHQLIFDVSEIPEGAIYTPVVLEAAEVNGKWVNVIEAPLTDARIVNLLFEDEVSDVASLDPGDPNASVDIGNVMVPSRIGDYQLLTDEMASEHYDITGNICHPMRTSWREADYAYDPPRLLTGSVVYVRDWDEVLDQDTCAELTPYTMLVTITDYGYEAASEISARPADWEHGGVRCVTANANPACSAQAGSWIVMSVTARSVEIFGDQETATQRTAEFASAVARTITS